MVLVDLSCHGVEVLAKGLEAKGGAVLDEAMVGLVGVEVGDDVVAFSLDELIDLLEGVDF